jgi:hypothetical protein
MSDNSKINIHFFHIGEIVNNYQFIFAALKGEFIKFTPKTPKINFVDKR